MVTRAIMLVAAGALALGGCKSIDQRTFNNNKKLYTQSAQDAVKAGDWENARRRYYLALRNAEWAESKPAELAGLNYEVGRASGVTCQFDAATKHLNQAYELDKRTSGPTYRALLELARVNLTLEKYVESVGYFERAMPELEKAKIAKHDPIGIAEAWEDYAKALEKSGNSSQAKSMAARAAQARAEHQGQLAAIAQTPYGSHCTGG
jgi:tetratricopeptide (TPR) repeat protein